MRVGLGLIHTGLRGTSPGGFPCNLSDTQIQSYLKSGATEQAVNDLCASACYFPLPGATEPPGLPECSQVPGGGTTNNPMIQGLLPGQPGYAAALQDQVLTSQIEEAANPAQDYGSAQYQTQLTALTGKPAPPSPPKRTPAPSPPPSSSTKTTQTQIQNAVSSPPASGGNVPVTVPASTNFLTASMIAGIPNWLLLAGVGVGAFLLFRGGR